MNSFVDVIDLYETASELGGICHVDAGTVRSWKWRDSIPSEHWPAIVQSKQGRAAQLTTDRLNAMVKPRAKPKRARAA